MNAQDRERKGKTVVTGATGFVGSYLCNDLMRRKRLSESFSFSAMLSGTEAPFPKEADTCVHLAARVHVMKETATDALAEFRRINTDGTISLARRAADAGCRRFVFISSIKVNGEETPVGNAFTADDEPRPQDPYGLSKYEAETGLKELAAEAGMDLVIIRPPLVYGPGVRANFLAMMKLLDRRLPLPFGLVNNRRSLALAIDGARRRHVRHSCAPSPSQPFPKNVYVAKRKLEHVVCEAGSNISQSGNDSVTRLAVDFSECPLAALQPAFAGVRGLVRHCL